MKLLFCPSCHDVHGLILQEWRMCLCGESGGQYNADGMTATIGGKGKVFGVGNPFFDILYPYLEVEGKRRMRQDMYGQPDTDAWWGEYKGDVQIFRIEDALGPRLKVKTDISLIPDTMTVKITDKRLYTIDGKERVPEVCVPGNPMVKKKITRWDKIKKKVQKKAAEILTESKLVEDFNLKGEEK